MSPSQLLVLRLVTATGLAVASDPGGELQVPPGADPCYATVALRAAGPGTPAARWYMDGAPFMGARWMLVPGIHRIGALGPGGQRAEISVTVE